MRELDSLGRVLDRRRAPVSVWWRDDDAGRADQRLAHLLDLAERLEVPLALAVVPAWLENNVALQIAACAQATVLQHGHAHEDHALPGQRRIELGGSANCHELAAELRHGRARLESVFGPRFLPVLVPPWNRIAEDLVPLLPDLGFRGLSLWQGTDIGPLPPGLARTDCHVDPVDWRADRRFAGIGAFVARLIAAVELAQDRPIGILTHHLVFEPEAFAATEQLLIHLRNHPNARLLSGEEALFGEA